MSKVLYPRRGALLVSLLLCSAAPIAAVAQDGGGAPPTNYGPQGYAAQNYASDAPPQGYAPQGYAPQGYAPQGYAPQGYAPQGYAPQGYAPQGYPPQGYASQGYAPQAYAPQPYASQANGPQSYPPQAYPPQGYLPRGYAAQGPAPQGYAYEGYGAQGYVPQPSAPQGYARQAYAPPPQNSSAPDAAEAYPQGYAPRGYPPASPAYPAPGYASLASGPAPTSPLPAAPLQEAQADPAPPEGDELTRSGYPSAPGGKDAADAGNPYAPGSATLAPASAPAPPAPPAGATSAEGPSLSPRIVSAASAYLSFMRRASGITPDFADGGGVARSVRVGAAYEPKQFQEGVIAYAAMVAMRDPAFVAGVQAAWTGDPRRADALAAELANHPDVVMQIAGAQSAAARAAAAIRGQGEHLMQAGMRVKQAAYDVQHSAWSKGDVLEPEARLAGAKRLSATPLSPSPEETTKLLNIVLAEETGTSGSASGATPLLSRGLALAALSLMGETEERSEGRLTALLTEERGSECLKMAKLNLFQCLAVAGPHYEDIFCLGQHALMDTAQCVISSSGGARVVSTASAAPAAVRSWTPIPGGGPGSR